MSVPPAANGDGVALGPDGQPVVGAGDAASGKGRETIAKRTLAERIAELHGLGQVQTLQVIQAFLDQIVTELSKGNRLEFRDFGVFETVPRKARTALNPKTLEKVPVRSRTVVKFKVGRLLKERVENLPPGSDGGHDEDDDEDAG